MSEGFFGDQRTKIRLSAVVAVYNDAPAIPIMYERLKTTFRKINVDYEIIFVNDGSPDNSRAVLAGLATQDEKVCVINHTRNFGSQSAFTSGMRIASGDACILLDGDLQDPPELGDRTFTSELTQVRYSTYLTGHGSIHCLCAFTRVFNLEELWQPSSWQITRGQNTGCHLRSVPRIFTFYNF